MPRTKPPYPPEFRRQAVELVRSGRTVQDVAESPGCSDQSLHNWVKQHQLDRRGRDDGLPTAEREELRAPYSPGRDLRAGAGQTRANKTIRVPGVRVADDLVDRQFTPAAPNVLWVADLTYLRDVGGLALPRRRAGHVLAAQALGDLTPKQPLHISTKRRLPRRLQRRPARQLRHPPSRPAHRNPPRSTLRRPVESAPIRLSRVRPASPRRPGSPSRWAPRATPTTTPSPRASSHHQERARAPPALVQQTRPQLRRLRVTSRRSTTDNDDTQPSATSPRGIRERDNHPHKQNLASQADCPRNRVHSRPLKRYSRSWTRLA
jgi:transposase